MPGSMNRKTVFKCKLCKPSFDMTRPWILDQTVKCNPSLPLNSAFPCLHHRLTKILLCCHMQNCAFICLYESSSLANLTREYVWIHRSLSCSPRAKFQLDYPKEFNLRCPQCNSSSWQQAHESFFCWCQRVEWRFGAILILYTDSRMFHDILPSQVFEHVKTTSRLWGQTLKFQPVGAKVLQRYLQSLRYDTFQKRNVEIVCLSLGYTSKVPVAPLSPDPLPEWIQLAHQSQNLLRCLFSLGTSFHCIHYKAFDWWFKKICIGTPCYISILSAFPSESLLMRIRPDSFVQLRSHCSHNTVVIVIRIR